MEDSVSVAFTTTRTKNKESVNREVNMLQKKEFKVILIIMIEDDFEIPFDEEGMEEFITGVMDNAPSPYVHHYVDDITDVTEDEIY